MSISSLVLAGGGAADDPEGAVVLKEVMDAAGDDPDIIILDLPPWSALEINALQRASTIMIQKSLKEGFGLTVTEAIVEGKAHDRERSRRHSDPGNRQTHGSAGALRGRLRLPDPLLADASGIRRSSWAKRQGAR